MEVCQGCGLYVWYSILRRYILRTNESNTLCSSLVFWTQVWQMMKDLDSWVNEQKEMKCKMRWGLTPFPRRARKVPCQHENGNWLGSFQAIAERWGVREGVVGLRTKVGHTGLVSKGVLDKGHTGITAPSHRCLQSMRLTIWDHPVGQNYLLQFSIYYVFGSGKITYSLRIMLSILNTM